MIAVSPAKPRALPVRSRDLQAYLELRMEEISALRARESAAIAKMRAEIDQVVANRIAGKEVRLGIRARTAARRAARLSDVHQKAVVAQELPVVSEPKPVVPMTTKVARPQGFSMTSMRGPDPSRAMKLAQLARSSSGRL